jgi:hypothetical protein
MTRSLQRSSNGRSIPFCIALPNVPSFKESGFQIVSLASGTWTTSESCAGAEADDTSIIEGVVWGRDLAQRILAANRKHGPAVVIVIRLLGDDLAVIIDQPLLCVRLSPQDQLFVTTGGIDAEEARQRSAGLEVGAHDVEQAAAVRPSDHRSSERSVQGLVLAAEKRSRPVLGEVVDLQHAQLAARTDHAEWDGSHAGRQQEVLVVHPLDAAQLGVPCPDTGDDTVVGERDDADDTLIVVGRLNGCEPRSIRRDRHVFDGRQPPVDRERLRQMLHRSGGVSGGASGE